MLKESYTIIERLMVFIDGGTLRDIMKKEFNGDDSIDWIALRCFIIKKFNSLAYPAKANLFRIYYYDGEFDKFDRAYKDQKKYFHKICTKKYYTLRLGEAIRDGDGRPRQKGVDVLMAIDALSKAYQNHYDTAIFIAGDRDFIPLIKAVKDTGKKIFGFYRKDSTPLDVRIQFDVRYSLKKEDLTNFRSKIIAKSKVRQNKDN